MKALTPVKAAWMVSGLIATAAAAVPLTEKIGNVSPEMFHALSGNFPAAHGYTSDLTLLVPATTVNKKYETRSYRPTTTTISSKDAAAAFKTPLPWSATPLKPLVPAVDPATNRTVPSSSR